MAIQPAGGHDGRREVVWDARGGWQVAAFEAPLSDSSSLHFEPGSRGLLYSTASRVMRRELHCEQRPGNQDVSVEVGPERRFASRPGFYLHEISANGKFWLAQRHHHAWVVWPEGWVEAEQILAGKVGFRRSAVTLSPDGHWLVGETSLNRGVSIWDTALNQLATNLAVSGHIAIKFTLDGRWLLTGTAGEYQAWEVGTWRSRARWPANLSSARGGVYPARNSTVAALVQAQASLQLVGLGTWQDLLTLEPPSEVYLHRAAWSPDSQRLYALGAGQRLYMWDLAELRKQLAGLGLDWEQDPVVR